MQKRKCILKNSVSGAVCEIEFDLEKSLINNLRVWCHTYGEQMRHFIPQKYYDAIMTDNIPKNMKIHCEICFEKQFVHISEHVVLEGQVGKLKEKNVIPEIRLNIDDYALSKNELDVYQDEMEESMEESMEEKKNQLIVVYQKINEEDNKNRKKKKKSKIIPILLGVAVLGAVGGFGVFSIVNNPVNKVKDMIDTGSYEAVVELYNEKISGNSEKEAKINETIDAYIDDLMKTYTNDNGTYDRVAKELKIFATIKNSTLAQQAEVYMTQIQLNEDANEIYQEAEAAFGAGDYLSALLFYSEVSEQAQVYTKAQEKYSECRGYLLETVANPQTAEDYEAYIEKVDGYLSKISDEEFITYKEKLINDYALLVENSVRTEILTAAENAYTLGNYSNMFEILENGLKELPGDIVLEEKLKEYQTKYVDVIKTQVDAQLQNKNYSQALAILSTAMSVYDCDEFKTLLKSVEQAKSSAMGTYNAVPVDFLIYEDSIANDDQKNEYNFTAPTTGRYGFAVYDLVSGFKITTKVYSVKTGDELQSYRGMTNNTYFCVDLVQGEKYKVVVEHYSGTGAYVLKVGQGKENVSIDNVNVVNDSIEYENQNNGYTFVPEYTGNYRLDFSNIVSGFKLSAYVYDSLGYEVGRYRGMSNGDGLTLELEAGEKYTIQVLWYSGVGDYTMSIGRQRYTSALSLGNAVTDTIDFTDQTNYYKFVSTETGSYILGFSDMESGFKLSVYVYDSLGYEVARYRGLSNDGTLKFDASAGEEYKISICFYSNMGVYKTVLNRNIEN